MPLSITAANRGIVKVKLVPQLKDGNIDFLVLDFVAGVPEGD